MINRKVVFMSAQPDTQYFHWQVEVLINNFLSLGINPNWIEVLWAHDGNPSYALLNLAQRYPSVRFFYYPKTVINNFGYIPILRPDILEQHFRKYPLLRGEVIFYHDSDIIFRELPEFDSIHSDHFWYLSDTRSYIGSNYIRSKSEDLFIDLCNLSNIEPGLVRQNEEVSGGAQYLMKGVTSDFWQVVKKDSLALYKFMVDREIQERTNLQNSGQDMTHYNPIQKWCADMWAVLWTAWKFGVQTKLTSEFDFSWGTSTLDTYNSLKIMHNAGVTEDLKSTYFYKGEYIGKSPFNADLSYVDPNTASAKYVDAILYAKSTRPS